ncbi:hypothetical protein ElyMa_005309300 [Elysia marginata]|uniref:Uncharacterized protein n=1 Tax=Elysia marginata TaxID=1093978 RepID=A0AAV4K0Q3_9GAST|nr:hypothetical protein ElyMa_005309300 [Elysia marginata]
MQVYYAVKEILPLPPYNPRYPRTDTCFCFDALTVLTCLYHLLLPPQPTSPTPQKSTSLFSYDRATEEEKCEKEDKEEDGLKRKIKRRGGEEGHKEEEEKG